MRRTCNAEMAGSIPTSGSNLVLTGMNEMSDKEYNRLIDLSKSERIWFDKLSEDQKHIFNEIRKQCMDVELSKYPHYPANWHEVKVFIETCVKFREIYPDTAGVAQL